MPRPGGGAFWSGTISFGLISVPVRLFPASRGSRVSLRMMDEDGTPLRRRFYCPAHDRLVEDDEIARGYELEEEKDVFELPSGGNGDGAADDAGEGDGADGDGADEVDLLETICMSLRSGNGATA